MNNQLEKAIELAKKTGDRLIIFENVNSDTGYVVMNLVEYEKLIIGKSEVRGLTEEELLDKINRDIAIWKSGQDLLIEREENENNYKYDFINNNSMSIADFSEIEKENRKKWSIPKEIKEGAEEVIEEDRQYLENII